MILIIFFSLLFSFFISHPFDIMAQTKENPTKTASQFDKEAHIQTIRRQNLDQFNNSLKEMSDMNILHDQIKTWEKESSSDSLPYSSEEETPSASPQQASDEYLKEHWKMKENRKWSEDLAPAKTHEIYTTPQF